MSATMPEASAMADIATPRRPPVHLFYVPQLDALRNDGIPAKAFCGTIIRKPLNKGKAFQDASPQCSECDRVAIERSWGLEAGE